MHFFHFPFFFFSHGKEVSFFFPLLISCGREGVLSFPLLIPHDKDEICLFLVLISMADIQLSFLFFIPMARKEFFFPLLISYSNEGYFFFLLTPHGKVGNMSSDLHAQFEVDFSSGKFCKNMRNIALSLIFLGIYCMPLGKIGKALNFAFSYSCTILTRKQLLLE